MSNISSQSTDQAAENTDAMQKSDIQKAKEAFNEVLAHLLTTSSHHPEIFLGAFFDLLHQAAINGSSEAQYMLGFFYEHGYDGFIKKDLDEAEKYYSLSANQGQPNAMFNFARCKLFGLGVTKGCI